MYLFFGVYPYKYFGSGCYISEVHSYVDIFFLFTIIPKVNAAVLTHVRLKCYRSTVGRSVGDKGQGGGTALRSVWCKISVSLLEVRRRAQ